MLSRREHLAWTGLDQVLTKYLVPRSAAGFYAMLMLLLALLALLLPHIQGDHSSGSTTETINQVINNCVTGPPPPPLGPRP
jgi:hypothetical protein